VALTGYGWVATSAGWHCPLTPRHLRGRILLMASCIHVV
jgi:hypothetical protein